MFQQKKDKILIIVSVLVICINMISLYLNKKDKDFEMNAEISRPIVELEKDDIIKKQIDEKSFPIEYHFWINNFKGEDINEIECKYTIEIDKTENNFPVQYTLIDCEKNNEIPLIDNKSNPISIGKLEKESREYKLILNWQELDTEMSENLKMNLKINVEQYEGKKI